MNKNINFTKHELNLIRIVIYNFLADIKYKDTHHTGNDISDYVRESLKEIEELGNRIDKEIRGWLIQLLFFICINFVIQTHTYMYQFVIQNIL